MPNRLIESTQRIILPLTNSNSITTTTTSNDTFNTTTITNTNQTKSTSLLDFISRLTKWSNNLNNYLNLKDNNNNDVNNRKEPITAFTSLSLTSKSNTPTTSTTKVGYLSNVFNSFSLIDLERSLLRVGVSKESDGIGLDIDLSSAFSSSPSPLPSSTNSPPQDKGPGLFLNYYSSEDLIKLFESTGVLKALARKGYNSPFLIIDTSEPLQHRLSLVDSSLFPSSASDDDTNEIDVKPTRNLASSERFLLDLYLKRRSPYTLSSILSYQLMHRLLLSTSWSSLRALTGEIRAPYVGLEGAREVVSLMEGLIGGKGNENEGKGKGDGDGWEVVEICWLQMHDPLKEVEGGRPLLPGQRFQGLGLGREIASLMEGMALKSRKTDALVNFPFHYHNAITYRSRGWKHLDPIFEAYLEWMTKQLELTTRKHGFCFVAWAGHLRRETYSLLPSPTTSSSSTSPFSSSSSPPTEEYTLLSSHLERYSPSEQLFPTSNSMKSYFDSLEYKGLLERYREIFREDGAANEEGVDVDFDVGEGEGEGEGDGEGEGKGEGKVRRRCRLVIDMENCPELWKYSLDENWRTRNSETGEFLITPTPLVVVDGDLERN